MRIIGFAIKKVSAERKNPIKDKLEIKSGLNIDDISQEELNLSAKPSLKFDFTFSIDYQPDIAKVEIQGAVIAIDDQNEGEEIIKDWKKKKFSHSSKLGLFNFIMDKCNLKSLHLEEEIGLPFHIPFPKLTPASKQENIKDSKENNPANYAG